MNNKFLIIAFVCFVILFTSCGTPNGNDPGTEYMPDMGHSIAYEANYYDYYYYNTWGSEEEYHAMVQPKKPVTGTIARGYAGVVQSGSRADQKAMMAHLNGEGSPNAISTPVNGSVPYYYANTEEERLRATAELIDNPFPITDAGLERAKDLYNIFCGICHGKKGDGNGYLVAEENLNAKYPAQPAILINDEFTATSNGRLYHAIMHGKNVMGNYADKLSYEERWQVVHYIRALQAKEKKLIYNEQENTLNTVDVPAATLKMVAQEMSHDDEHSHNAAHHSENHSGESHGSNDAGGEHHSDGNHGGH